MGEVSFEIQSPAIVKEAIGPARRRIGGDTCETLEQTLLLPDTMVHTAEFDHTLILNGAFSFTYDGSNLVLFQEDQEYQRLRRINLTRE